MKNYRITVNGTAYDVAVEELGAMAPCLEARFQYMPSTSSGSSSSSSRSRLYRGCSSNAR